MKEQVYYLHKLCQIKNTQKLLKNMIFLRLTAAWTVFTTQLCQQWDNKPSDFVTNWPAVYAPS